MRRSESASGRRLDRCDGTVLVASGGGHLQQLATLAPRMGLGSDVIWATPRSGLAEGLLKGKEYFELPYSMPRDWHAAIKLTKMAHSMLKEYGARRVISTGASPAPPFFLAAAKLGLEMHYIESATRSTGPSLSGSLVERIPSTHLYTQYPAWAQGRWHYAGSILDPYTAVPATPSGPIRKAVVSLGTEGYPFRRALERLVRILPADAEVLWQTGHTPTDGLGIVGHQSVPGDEFREHIAAADVFICHAGTGSALTAFELGKVPVILTREARHGEHVDDHQQLTANELTRRGLVISVPLERLTVDHLEQSRYTRVVRSLTERPFDLQGSRSGRSTTIDLRVPTARVGIGSRGSRARRDERLAQVPQPRTETSPIRVTPDPDQDVIRLP